MKPQEHVLHIFLNVLTTVLGILVPAVSPGGVLAHYSWAPLVLTALLYVGRLVATRGGPPAAAVVLALFLLPALGGAMCIRQPLTPTVPDGGFADASPGTTFVDCSEANLHARALALLPTIMNGLASGNLDAFLATAGLDLAVPAVFAEVQCAVAWAIADLEKQAATTADSLSAQEVATGKAWQAAHPATVKAQ